MMHDVDGEEMQTIILRTVDDNSVLINEGGVMLMISQILKMERI